jgi:hypothetical protein
MLQANLMPQQERNYIKTRRKFTQISGCFGLILDLAKSNENRNAPAMPSEVPNS